MLKLTVHLHKLQKTILGRRFLGIFSASEKFSAGLKALETCGAGEFPKDIETILLSMDTSRRPPESVFVTIRTQLDATKTLDLISEAKPIHEEGTHKGSRLVKIARGAALTFLGSDLLLSSLGNIERAIEWGEKRARSMNGKSDPGDDFVQKGMNLGAVPAEHMIRLDAETKGIVKKMTSKMPVILQGIKTWQLLFDLEDEALVLFCAGELEGATQATQAAQVLNGMVLLGAQSGLLQKFGFPDWSEHVKISAEGEVLEIRARLPFKTAVNLISMIQSRVAPLASKSR